MTTGMMGESKSAQMYSPESHSAGIRFVTTYMATTTALPSRTAG
jgi:hypothetical protein